MKSERVRLRVLHTNDLHSHFEQMPRVASIIRRLRSEAGEDLTLTLDIGDHLDRMHPYTEGTNGLANVAVLNETGYDAVTIGNNEGLTFTHDLLAAIYREAQFQVLASNLPEAATGKLPSWAVPSVIIDKSGIRIGMIGVTAYFTDYYQLLGWDIREPLEVTQNLVRELRHQVDVLIVLSHLGLRFDERMAEEIEGIDLILGGHTHHLLEKPKRMQETLVCATGKFGQYVGVVDLEYDKQAGCIVSSDGWVVSVTQEESPDTAVQEVIERHAEKAGIIMNREVALLEQELPIRWDGESPLGNLLAAGIRHVTGADMSVVNAGQLLMDLPKGAVTAGQLLALCPSPINPCLISLTGAELLEALEQSLLAEYREKPIYGYGFRGKVLGSLCVDGMTIHYDPLGEEGSRILAVLVRGVPLDPQQTYLVGTIDMFTFGIGYVSLSRGKVVRYFLPDFIRDVLLRELRSGASLDESRQERWMPAPG